MINIYKHYNSHTYYPFSPCCLHFISSSAHLDERYMSYLGQDYIICTNIIQVILENYSLNLYKN